MGYFLSVTDDGLKLSGDPVNHGAIKSNFRHFTNAMQSPTQNIYRQLNIDIPDEQKVKRHTSGVYDAKFITFQLPQIVLENQQSSLVWSLFICTLFVLQ